MQGTPVTTFTGLFKAIFILVAIEFLLLCGHNVSLSNSFSSSISPLKWSSSCTPGLSSDCGPGICEIRWPETRSSCTEMKNLHNKMQQKLISDSCLKGWVERLQHLQPYFKWGSTNGFCLLKRLMERCQSMPWRRSTLVHWQGAALHTILMQYD